ncbi:MAG: NAD-binding protein [Candidatus ainarchaeum sp.]|mgnify:CR=1 FL=1|jgi:voltage-gated potassium channel|nr:NAD-binding protein [Candidatus ainarchaeum sp.]MDD3085964.1 NAD-binding protein [Candidatus ainarchaeum sp.]MDD4128252.1 NAD-binding protein [Candidatus ainarchaeum sp.]MDD4467869.1 NAD-binding protein [Candidatus ainarchaeum sp.]HPM85712.1 NAD-binding protein [archaeon]
MSRGASLKEVDEFPRRIKIFVKIILLLIIFGTISFSLISSISLEQGLFRTLETLAFIFSDESNFAERLLEIFLAIVGVFLVWWVLWSLADMLLDRNLERYLNKKFNDLRVSLMNNHIIIIGGGRFGSEIASNLEKKRKKFLIIENNSEVIKILKKKKYLVIEGNAEDDKVLIEAGIEKATKIILTLPKTESNVLITLTSKELNPKIDVFARAYEQKFVSKLKKAGAKVVIVPEVVAGDKLSEIL